MCHGHFHHIRRIPHIAGTAAADSRGVADIGSEQDRVAGTARRKSVLYRCYCLWALLSLPQSSSACRRPDHQCCSCLSMWRFPYHPIWRRPMRHMTMNAGAQPHTTRATTSDNSTVCHLRSSLRQPRQRGYARRGECTSAHPVRSCFRQSRQGEHIPGKESLVLFQSPYQQPRQ